LPTAPDMAPLVTEQFLPAAAPAAPNKAATN